MAKRIISRNPVLALAMIPTISKCRIKIAPAMSQSSISPGNDSYQDSCIVNLTGPDSRNPVLALAMIPTRD